MRATRRSLSQVVTGQCLRTCFQSNGRQGSGAQLESEPATRPGTGFVTRIGSVSWIGYEAMVFAGKA